MMTVEVYYIKTVYAVYVTLSSIPPNSSIKFIKILESEC